MRRLLFICDDKKNLCDIVIGSVIFSAPVCIMALIMNFTDSAFVKSLYDHIYESIFEKVVEEKMIINCSQTVNAKESKLSVRSITPYTKTQINFLGGNQFYGDLIEWRMVGNGRYTWADDGSFYEGEFAQPNMIEGRGTFNFRDAYDEEASSSPSSSSASTPSTGFSRYCGNFVNGMYHGRGQLINCFFKYNGNFERDKFHGKGTMQCGIESFDGLFESGKKVSGQRIYINGVFNGDYDESEMRKCGRYNFDNGDCYCGAFENGLFDGFGEYIWSSSSYESLSYRGFWKENCRHGLGMLNVRGTFCTTVFEKDKKSGSGAVWARNNKIFASKIMFEDDVYNDGKEIAINQENIGMIKDLFDLSALQRTTCEQFVANIALLEDKYTSSGTGTGNEESTKLLTYPFHLNWFDLHVEHDAIWEFVSKFPNTNKQQESTSLVQFIREHANTFREFYRQYAEFSARVLFERGETTKSENERNGKMTRVGLWQFFRDLGLYRKSPLYNTQRMIEMAEMEFNILTLDTYSPFEIVSIANFLYYILHIVLFMNKRHAFMLSCAINQRSKLFGLFATMCVLFTRDFLINMQPMSSGNVPKLIQEDKGFFINFIKGVVDYQSKSLTIRAVFQMMELLKKKQTESGDVNKLKADSNGNAASTQSFLIACLVCM
jgi:hypothetical protein